MNQGLRLLAFLIVLFVPWSGIAFVEAHNLRRAAFDGLLRVSIIIFVSLVLTVVLALARDKAIGRLTQDQLAKAALANLLFVVCDGAIFALLSAREFGSSSACDPATTCLAYPAMWLALAGMHLCYAAWCYITLHQASE